MAKPSTRYSRYARNFLLLFATQAELTTTVTMLGAPLPARMLLAIHSLRVVAIGALFLAAVIQLAIRTQPAKVRKGKVDDSTKKADELKRMDRKSRARNALANTLLMTIKLSIPVLMLTAGLAQWPLINVLVGFIVILSAATLLMPWIVQGLVAHNDAANQRRADAFGTEEAKHVEQDLKQQWQKTLLKEYIWLTVVVGVGALGLLLLHELSGMALFSTHAVFASAVLLLTVEVLRRSLSADTAPVLWGASSTAALGVLLTAWGLHEHMSLQALHGVLPMMGLAMVLASALVLIRAYAPNVFQPHRSSLPPDEEVVGLEKLQEAINPAPSRTFQPTDGSTGDKVDEEARDAAAAKPVVQTTGAAEGTAAAEVAATPAAGAGDTPEAAGQTDRQPAASEASEPTAPNADDKGEAGDDEVHEVGPGHRD